MTQGILYVVFGDAFESMAFATIKYSRQFTSMPIHILTNIKTLQCDWSGLSVSFTHINAPQSQNRDIKTRMIEYSPFDMSLYIDCDAVIQKEGIYKLFSMLDNADIVLNSFLLWNKKNKILRLYANAMKIAQLELPITVYNGALIGFIKNTRTREFFTLWNTLWKKNGSGREMPALACAVKKTPNLCIETFKKNILAPDARNTECLVQHNYNTCGQYTFSTEFNIPKIASYKPFDNNPKDWNWVYYD